MQTKKGFAGHLWMSKVLGIPLQPSLSIVTTNLELGFMMNYCLDFIY